MNALKDVACIFVGKQGTIVFTESAAQCLVQTVHRYNAGP